MRIKVVVVGAPVWRYYSSDGRRPAIVSHIDAPDIWVSFTDRLGGQAKVTAADLEPRRTPS